MFLALQIVILDVIYDCVQQKEYKMTSGNIFSKRK